MYAYHQLLRSLLVSYKMPVFRLCLSLRVRYIMHYIHNPVPLSPLSQTLVFEMTPRGRALPYDVGRREIIHSGQLTPSSGNRGGKRSSLPVAVGKDAGLVSSLLTIGQCRRSYALKYPLSAFFLAEAGLVTSYPMNSAAPAPQYKTDLRLHHRNDIVYPRLLRAPC